MQGSEKVIRKREQQDPIKTTLSIIIPVYNEEDSLPFLVEKLLAVLKPLEMTAEMIFVDDGSTDSSREVLRQLKKKSDISLRIIVLEKNSGQSAAFAAGFKIAEGNIFATLDADLQNDPADIPLLLALLDQYDMACGWRKNRRDSWLRKISTRISNPIRSYVLKDPFHDTACSMRVFRKECVEGLVMFNGMHRFLPTLVRTAGYRVGEVVIRHHHRQYGQAKYNIRNRIFKTIADLFGVLWLQSRHLRYKIEREE